VVCHPFDLDQSEHDAEEGWSPLERIGGRPSADVNGVWGGHTGVGSRTVIPAEAPAKVSFRLVADQDPAKLGPLFERWVRDHLSAHHAPNQRLLPANYHRGVRAAAYTFEELARPEVMAALRAWRR
jgi:acetylornithine deacetylase/succinyl-diaminopimelate desuccinylase-like protein